MRVPTEDALSIVQCVRREPNALHEVLITMRGAMANGEELQAVQLRRGLTQEQLATAANVDVKTVRKAERGRRLDLGTLARLAFALQTDLAQLIRRGRSEMETQINRRDVIMRWHRAWDAQDIEALLVVYHDRAVLHLPGGPNIPFGGTFEGKDAIRHAHEAAWSACRTEPVRAQDISVHVNDTVAVLSGIKGIHLPNGEIVRLWSLQVFTFDGDLISDHRVEYDTLTFARLLQLPTGNAPAGE